MIGIIMAIEYEGFNACGAVGQRLRRRKAMAADVFFMCEKEGGFDPPFVMYAHFASSCMPFCTTLFALHFRPFSRPYVCAYILYMYVYIILYISLWESMNKSVARKGLSLLYRRKNEDVRALNGV